MTLHTEEERQLWKDAVLRAVKCIKQKAQPYATIADMLVEAYRERLPKPDDSPAQENKPEQETPAIKMEWRDARPEDVGKGLRCRVRDYDIHPWSEYVATTHEQRILKNYNEHEANSWSTCPNSLTNIIGTSWRFCQVYAPVEPTPTDDGWKPIEECPDGVIVELLSTNLTKHPRIVGKRFDGSSIFLILVEGKDRKGQDKFYPSHFRPIGGCK